MVSAQLCLIAAVATIAAFCVDQGHGGKWKCNYPNAIMEEKLMVVNDCWVEATGKPINEQTKEDQNSKEIQVKVMKCVAVETGVLNDDGTINVKQAHAQVKEMESSSDVKKQVDDSIDECVAKGGDSDAVLGCMHTSLQTVCSGK